jgi:hypothetical protein
MPVLMSETRPTNDDTDSVKNFRPFSEQEQKKIGINDIDFIGSSTSVCVMLISTPMNCDNQLVDCDTNKTTQ